MFLIFSNLAVCIKIINKKRKSYIIKNILKFFNLTFIIPYTIPVIKYYLNNNKLLYKDSINIAFIYIIPDTLSLFLVVISALHKIIKSSISFSAAKINLRTALSVTSRFAKAIGLRCNFVSFCKY